MTVAAIPLEVTDVISFGRLVSRQGRCELDLPTDAVKLLPGMTLYFPLAGCFDLRKWDVKAFYVRADQPVRVAVEESGDGSTFAELEGYVIEAADFVADKWNTIITDAPMEFVRLKVQTQATPPTYLKMRLLARVRP